jgi:mono/diheme cytochrome c family protein
MKECQLRGAVLLLVVAATFVFLSTGCKNLPPSKPLSELTPQEAAGHVVYVAKCARCHYPNSTRGLNGPGLQALYKQPYMPSGAPANDDRVSSVILHGRNMMPAYSKELDDQQLADLMAYLHTL